VTPQLIIPLVVFTGMICFALFRFFMRVRRRRALKVSLPAEWLALIEQNIPPYRHLPDDLKSQLHGYIREFLFDKRFEGCGGQELTDEIRVTIAAQACLLLLNRHVRCYPRLMSVVVYPSAYFAPDEEGGKEVRLGESWTHGTVVLAWDSVKRGALNFDDGQNLVIHEFAHQLDQEDGAGDGAPTLASRSSYTIWARVLSDEYSRLRSRVEKGKKTVLDSYGATNPAEFFAVASETFFEKPEQMRKKHPELFDELKLFYNVDPSEWV
jgi:Mlc titration factor MtfA (ptsG expression regulator)